MPFVRAVVPVSPQRTAASRRRRPSLQRHKGPTRGGGAWWNRPLLGRTYHEASRELLNAEARLRISVSCPSKNESRAVLCQAQHVVGRADGISTIQHRTGLTRPLQNLSVHNSGTLGPVFFNHNRDQHKKTMPGLSIKCGDDLVAPPCKSRWSTAEPREALHGRDPGLSDAPAAYNATLLCCSILTCRKVIWASEAPLDI